MKPNKFFPNRVTQPASQSQSKSVSSKIDWTVVNNLFTNAVVTKEQVDASNVTVYHILTALQNRKYYNIGHLIQVELFSADVWTVYSMVKAMSLADTQMQLGGTKDINKSTEIETALASMFKTSRESARIWLKLGLVDNETINAALSKSYLGGRS